MTTTDRVPVPPSAPPAGPDSGSWPRGRHRPGRARVAGIDAARGLAVLGMIVAHVAVAAGSSWLVQAVNGRAAVLFAVLGGVSLSLMAAPVLAAPTARNRVWLRRRIAVRGLLLVVLGLLLAEISSGPMVILVVYGVLFWLLLPVLFAPARALAVAAAVWAVAGPLLSWVLRARFGSPTDADGQTVLGATVHLSDLTSPAGLVHALDTVLLSGAYPVLTWMPFLLLGMAVGRLDLRTAGTGLVAGGAAGAVLGYGGSWLALDVLGGRDALLASVAPLADRLGVPAELALQLLGGSALGTVATTTPAWLLAATPHSGSPFDVVGAAGVAVAVLGLCLLAARYGGRLLAPLTATGALALTLYAGHIALLASLGEWPQTAPWAATALVAGLAVASAWAWRGLVGRGPLEALVHSVSVRAADSPPTVGDRGSAPAPMPGGSAAREARDMQNGTPGRAPDTIGYRGSSDPAWEEAR
ncbi:heparan-alpha-glucosaminide N-acetyltransferase domain-containing protein [Pseudonocardia sp. McavD-2-B]|uniref:heparan-alpha-glucosaminide N-acetyltransferase domain-containing protein n=1 Tax=Pseudonocardia sp. McavD-2-B TaxID=2954499 RepID=UPI0020974E2C|nr:heparan-alpha-glucosaminide N-acetyltransferase domain-containing protein [Pseudonocardia sp. McavD-2-B]MCO7195910.1 heparan-alpha-glucosaminide N-acetyltransferase domain-containing protein [Pseudonocardia sp. McavD-2-B]